MSPAALKLLTAAYENYLKTSKKFFFHISLETQTILCPQSMVLNNYMKTDI